MKKNIIIKKLNFSYKNEKIFDDFNMNIFDVDTTIIGTPASGKTTLAKIFAGIFLSDEVSIYRQKLNEKNLYKIRKNVNVILNDFLFIAETVEDELAFGMENLCYSKDIITEKIKKISKTFDIKNIIHRDPNTIDNEQKALIKIISVILMNPSTIIIDGLLTYLTKTDKIKLLKLLEEEKIQLINITSDIEESLLTEYLIVMDNGKILVEGETKSVLSEEKILKRLGFNLPFMIDLSKQLLAYDLIEKIYYDEDELVGVLWK